MRGEGWSAESLVTSPAAGLPEARLSAALVRTLRDDLVFVPELRNGEQQRSLVIKVEHDVDALVKTWGLFGVLSGRWQGGHRQPFEMRGWEQQ